MSLADLFIRLRLERDLTQRQIATSAGIDASLISRVELGHGKPSMKTAIKILNTLQKHRPISPDDMAQFCDLAGIAKAAKDTLVAKAKAGYDDAAAKRADMLDCYDVVNILIAERGTQRVLRFLLAARDIIQE